MDAPASPEGTPPGPATPQLSAAAQPADLSNITASWDTLLEECTRLHSQLEYLHLMLRLGVHRF